METSAETRHAAELIEEGIAALISGRKAQARLLLGQALVVDPHSEEGWLWLSGAVDTDEERRFCLRQVLSINGRNPAAQKGWRQLGPGPVQSPIALPAAPATPARPELTTPITKLELSAAAVEAEPPAAAAEPEPPGAEAPTWSQWRQEAASTEAPASPLPRAWLIVAAILAAGVIVGLALLFVINIGLLGK